MCLNRNQFQHKKTRGSSNPVHLSVRRRRIKGNVQNPQVPTTWIAALVPGPSDQLAMTLPCAPPLGPSPGLCFSRPSAFPSETPPASLPSLSFRPRLCTSVSLCYSVPCPRFAPCLDLPAWTGSGFRCLGLPTRGRTSRGPSAQGEAIKASPHASSRGPVAAAGSLPLSLEIAFAFCCQIRIFSAVKNVACESKCLVIK